MIHTTRELEEIQKNFIEMEVKSFAREVIEFIDESPSTYHVVKNCSDILDENVPIEEILKMIPAGRMGDPEEVAHAVNFLMDEKAGYITRQVIAVNGGLC